MVEISLTGLFILFLMMMFILSSLFLYLVLKKYFKNEQRRRILEIKEELRLDMFHYLHTGKEDFPGVRSIEQERLEALVELLGEYSHVLDGSHVKDRIHNFAKRYLTDHIMKEIKKKRWSLRMNALYSIESFYMNHCIDLLHEMYHSKRTSFAERAQILKLFALFKDHQIVHYMKTIDPQQSDFVILSVLSIMEEETLRDLLADFDSLPKKLQYMLTETIGRKQWIQQHSLLYRLLLEDDEELKIRALKAYALSGIPIQEDLMETFFDSENWQMRMMAIKVAGVQRIERYKEKLIEQLSHREYIVRAEAAKAILRFKDGEGVLTEVTEKSNDLFARDMAIEWLEKGRGHHFY